MKRYGLSAFLFLIIFIIYLLFSSVRTADRDLFKINRYFSTDSEAGPLPSEELDGYYYTDNECGYFSSDKGLTFRKRTYNGDIIDANKYFFIIYGKVGNTIGLFSKNGEKIKDIPSYGYPYISGDFPVFYIIATNGMSISAYSSKGELLFDEINFPSMISCVSTDNDLNTLISITDGETNMYSVNGTNLFTCRSSGSRISISRSNTIETNGKRFAVSEGIDPEYISLFSREKWRNIKKIKTASELNYSIYMHITKRKLYYESKDGLSFSDLNGGSKGKITINGELREISFSPKGNILTVTADGATNFLTVFTHEGARQFYKEFRSPVSNARFINEKSFYFKLEDLIIKMNIGEKV
jgi:hypothetical protein